MSQQLLQQLGENATATTDGGWDEETDDRKVEATEDRLDLTTTFEHFDDRGGRHRVTFTFLVLEDLLVDENSRDNLPLSSTTEELQDFVDEHVYYDGAC